MFRSSRYSLVITYASTGSAEVTKETPDLADHPSTSTVDQIEMANRFGCDGQSRLALAAHVRQKGYDIRMEDSAHAFLLLAHSDEKMFNRLVNRLCAVGPVYAHIDRKTDISTWSIARPNLVVLENRIKVYWGDWSMVEATVRLINEALQDTRITRLTLVSGSHYPLLSAKELVERSKVAGNIIAARPATGPSGARPASQYRRRYVRSRWPNGNWSKFLNAFVNRILFARRPLRWEEIVGTSGMRAGSAYWSLERESAQYCIDRIETNDDLIKFFGKIVCADEKIFNTLFAEFDPNEHNKGTTYAKWAGKPNPEVLTVQDLEFVRQQSEFWFARKFSSERDQEIMDWLDAISQ